MVVGSWEVGRGGGRVFDVWGVVGALLLLLMLTLGDKVSLKLSGTRRACFFRDVDALKRATLFRHQHPTRKNGINSMPRSLVGLYVVFLVWFSMLYFLAECSM
jgi:hypothetical protein